MTVDAALAQLLDDVPCLVGQPRRVEELPGGLTNENYRVRTATRDVVVRISSPSTGLLAVDRDHEHHNAVIAAEAGIGPAVVDYLPGRGVLVVEFVPSRTYADADVPANLPAVADAVRRLHAARPFANRFDMFDIQRRYVAIMADGGFRMPHGYLEHAAYVQRMETALAVRPEPIRPCHNDLLAANFLDDGQRLWIIDYEYSGNNEPSFELGNIIQEARLTTDHLTELCAHYYGRDDPALVARAELWATMSAYGWTLWGTIQAASSEIDFDFWAWGTEKYERALEAFASKRFAELLDIVGEAS